MVGSSDRSAETSTCASRRTCGTGRPAARSCRPRDGTA
jgi:hypothetical protein